MDTEYITLTGEKIDLSGLTDEEKVFLGTIVKAYEAGEAYPNFVNRVHTPGSPALCGGEWVNEKVVFSPLYQICQDLANRLGITQGFLARGPNSSMEGTGFVKQSEPEYLSAQQAAELIGLTAEAVRKAIREKRLSARRVGKTYLVRRRAILAYDASRNSVQRSISARVLTTSEKK